MFQRLRLSIVSVALIVFLPGCAVLRMPLHIWTWKKKPPRATAKVDLLVGTVAMVNEDAAFVLIDNGTTPAPTAGTVLKIKTTPAAAPVELRTTAVRRPPFVVADIVKGMPKKGDQVFQ